MAKEPLVWEAVSGSAPPPSWLCLPSLTSTALQSAPTAPRTTAPLVCRAAPPAGGLWAAWEEAAGMAAQASPDVLAWDKTVWDMGCPRSRAGCCVCAVVVPEEPQGQQCGAVLGNTAGLGGCRLPW